MFKYKTGLFLALVTILCMGILSLRMLREYSLSLKNLEQIRRNLNLVDEILISANEAETAQRGYLLTGRKNFLQPFFSAEKVLPQDLATLEKNSSSFPEIIGDLTHLKTILGEKFQFMRNSLDVYNQKRFKAAMVLVHSGKGQQLMEEIRTAVKRLDHKMEEEETRLSQEVQKAQKFTNGAIIFGSFLASFFLLVAAYLLKLDFTRREEVEKERDLFFTTSLDMLCLANMDGYFIRLNPAFEETLGHKEKDLLERPFMDFVHPDDVAPTLKEMEKLGQGGLILTFENRYRCKDGTYKWFSWKASPAGGTIVAAARDITNQKLLDQELIRAREEADAASRAKSDFLANIGHEIRTPMNAIIGITEILTETPLNEEQKNYVETFRKAGNNLLTLINDLLDMAKIEAGDLPLEKIDFDLMEVMESTLELFAPRAHAKNLEISLDMGQFTDVWVLGDPLRLRQILLNLIGNAIKFTSQGEVNVIVERKGQKGKNLFVFTVRDTGIGIPEEKKKYLFQRFSQVDSSITRRFGGTGLGLSISRQLVELMGGTIKLESREGEGSSFSFEIEWEVVPSQTPAENEDAPLNLSGMKTLIVDDNDTNRLILKKMLETWGAHPVSLDSGEAALREIQEAQNGGDPYKLLLVDYRMPGMDGFELAEKVRALGVPPQLMMMCSSDNRKEMNSRARDLGVGKFLLKPLKSKELRRALRQSMTGKAAPVAVRENSPRPVLDQRPLRILLVDDNEDNCLIVTSFLKSTSYQVEVASNGRMAVDKFREGTFDLILMDMQMPILDGYGATREIRDFEKGNGRTPTPIIALTAYARQEEIERSLEAGCTSHLTKPIKKAVLLKSIMEIIPWSEPQKARPSSY